ncbi:OmpW family protein [Marinicauda algicola]|uniref:OmpW family protein n=1 Tax=Marinicauda algicola TaxID=2029849 RepID=A0A4S2H081_9PROT|nr:OmpW family outer membrane protein [Marinicauda algicola]TGY88783.1 OmpW family protein [Marinicauda algicola]
MRSNLVFGLIFGLGLVSLSCPAQAQDNPTGSAYATETYPSDFRRWLLHVDVANVFTNESAEVAVGGAPVPNGSVSMADNQTISFDVSYFLTPNLAINVYAGYPPRAHIKGAGTLEAFGTLASANYGPLTVSGEYHFSDLGAFRPYVGVGVTYAVFLNVDDAALSDVNVENAFGPALKLGLDYDISERWTLHGYVQQVWLSTDVSATVGGVPASAKVAIDPTIVGVGLGYRF